MIDTDAGTATIFIGDIMFGDLNGDGLINLLDVQPFIDALSSGDYNANADMNQDALLTCWMFLCLSTFFQGINKMQQNHCVCLI